MRIPVFLLVTGLLCLSQCSFSQQKAGKPGVIISKNRVSRIINVGDTTFVDYSTQVLPGLKKDLLSEMLTNKVMNGKVPAYTPENSELRTIIPVEKLRQQLYGSDTINMEDPVSGDQVTKIINHAPQFVDMRRFRVLEERNCNKTTGETATKILAIAPIRSIYGDMGDYRGIQTIFWLKYKDVADVLQQYDQQYPDEHLRVALWGDNTVNE